MNENETWIGQGRFAGVGMEHEPVRVVVAAAVVVVMLPVMGELLVVDEDELPGVDDASVVTSLVAGVPVLLDAGLVLVGETVVDPIIGDVDVLEGVSCELVVVTTVPEMVVTALVVVMAPVDG